ncbi:hypothetical protein M405DRAFT_867543 [Rhizopogon salebrosus TDB-379]|nr:hypothetical protein M405DRAFT_867543 [Rhizopogon salebrosus TDB-379]
MGKSASFFVVIPKLSHPSLSPDARYLVGALRDRSICIWNLRTNKPVGNSLLHDDDLCDLAISPDGKYIVTAGVDTKIYVWNLDVALGGDRVGVRVVHGRNVEPEAILKGRPAPPTDQTNSRVTRYDDDFWGNDASHARRPRSAPPVGPSPLLGRRNFLRFDTRPANASQPIAPQPRHREFRFSPVRPSIHTVNVAPARDEDESHSSS